MLQIALPGQRVGFAAPARESFKLSTLTVLRTSHIHPCSLHHSLSISELASQRFPYEHPPPPQPKTWGVMLITPTQLLCNFSSVRLAKFPKVSPRLASRRELTVHVYFFCFTFAVSKIVYSFGSRIKPASHYAPKTADEQHQNTSRCSMLWAYRSIF